MSIVEPGSGRANLIARVRNLLLQPGATWDEIDREPATVRGLYVGYVIPLVLVSVVAGLVGHLVFGASVGLGPFGGITVRYSPVWLVGQAVLQFGFSLASVYILARIIDALAPNFGATPDPMRALKVAAYAPTASWAAGAFGLFPPLGIVIFAGAIYSLFLLYWGLPKLMRAPAERAGSYFGVVLVVAILVNLVIAIIVGGVMSWGGNAARLGGDATVSGTINVPGGGSVNVSDLEKAGRAAEAAARQMESGEGPPATDPDVLKTYLPATIGGFSRTEVTASTGGIGGIEGSGAEGTYARGDARLQLEVVDLGSAGALAGMAGAFNIKSTKESADGYEKVGKVGGRFTQEEYDKSSKHGEYSVLVGDRFMVHAEANDVSMDELKGAVNAVGFARLEALAKAK